MIEKRGSIAAILDHEKLDIYQVSIEFVVFADRIVEQFPRGRAYLSDQLNRAALSISLNIAEGAGEYAMEEKARFYRMAKRSATECAGILDVCQRLGLVDDDLHRKGREFIVRIVSMLIKIIRSRGGRKEEGKGEKGEGKVGHRHGHGHAHGREGNGRSLF